MPSLVISLLISLEVRNLHHRPPVEIPACFELTVVSHSDYKQDCRCSVTSVVSQFELHQTEDSESFFLISS